jgi:uncharacterized protein
MAWISVSAPVTHEGRRQCGVLIADPLFYAVAIPAVLLMGLAKSGFLAGFGSLATPMIALTLTVPKAAALMLPLLLVMDATGVQQLWRDRDAALFKRLLIPALLGIAVGTVVFGLMSVKVIAGVVGALALMFVAHRRWLAWRKARMVDSAGAQRTAEPPLWWGRLMAMASGFTSFVAHAGGPPMMAYTLHLNITPVRLTATMAVLFAVINASKVVPYISLGLFDASLLMTSLALAPLAPLGVWVGVWLTRRVSVKRFHDIADAGMLCAGLKLLHDAS